ncbi:MAG: hypothetical protein COA97_03540 [Flavobacteriales bacterium]|nr:MAG: hypothetical protein COA97_03540 [Flavobacteriales bacterium]
MTTIKHILGIFVLALLLLSGCKKDTDFPPVKVLPEGNIITIDSLRNIYTAFDTTIVDDISIYGIVTADESTGNIYKELFIQDEANAIKLGLTSSSNYFIGDRIRVAIKGATITNDNSMLIIDNIDPDASIVKQESSMDLTPEIVTISDIQTLFGDFSVYQAKLVQINNVEFPCYEVCNTWANSITQSDENRDLTDTLGNTIVVRSSGFANFAGQTLPQGQGSIIAVVTQYKDNFGSITIQLTIRNPNELTMSGTRKISCPSCPTYLHIKNWNDNNVTSGGWTTQYPTPNNSWTTDDFTGSNPYAYITNTSNTLAGESWLISPAFDLSSTSTPFFNFETAAASGTTTTSLKVLISTNYDGVSLPASATWADVSAPLAFSTGSWTWTASGDFDLAPYRVSGVYVAFKYTSTGATWDTWEVDNFNLFDF